MIGSHSDYKGKVQCKTFFLRQLIFKGNSLRSNKGNHKQSQEGQNKFLMRSLIDKKAKSLIKIKPIVIKMSVILLLLSIENIANPRIQYLTTAEDSPDPTCLI